MYLLALILGCGGPPTERVPSERGPDMLLVPAGAVLLGNPGSMEAPEGDGPPLPPRRGPDAPPKRGKRPPLVPDAPPPDHGVRSGGLLPPYEAEVSAFWIDRTEVTRAQYQAFLVDTGFRPPFVDEPWAQDGWNWNGTDYPADTADHPVVLTSWYDARAYCAWAGKRLPTEGEWQLAALGRIEDARRYPWGMHYGNHVNHGRRIEPFFDGRDGWLRTSPVEAFPSGASWVGALDMFGNAWEWTADFRVDSHDDLLGEWTAPAGTPGRRIVDPHTRTYGLYVAVRGGSYYFELEQNPAAERNAFLPEIRRKTSGFRCARSTRPDQAGG